MSLSSILFGKAEKAKRLAPLKMTAEETFLMNYLMNMYMNKGSGPMGDYTKAMNKIMGTGGVPINYNGRQIASMKPLNTMKTLGTLAQETLKNQVDPAMDMWKNMMSVRYGGTAVPGSSTPGLVNTLGPSLITSGQAGGLMSGLTTGLEAAGSALSSGLPAIMLA